VQLIDAANGTQLQSMSSGTSGLYSFTVVNGTYNLLVTAPTGSAYASGPANGIVVSNQNVSQDIVLIAGAKKLSGVIYGAGAVPLPNVKVNLVPAGGSTNGSNTVLASMTTNALGQYSFDVAPGGYKLNLEHYGAAWGGVMIAAAEPGQNWRAYSLGTVTVSNDAVNDIRLPFVALSGKTKDGAGVAVGNVTLDSVWNYSSWTDANGVAYSVYIDGESKAVSDAQGNYSIVVHSGGASLTLTPPAASAISPIVLSVNVTANTVQDISLKSEYNLSGVIYGAGNVPLPNVKLNLVPSGGSTNGNNTVLASLTTNATGQYSFGVGAGGYKLNLEHYGAGWGGVMIPAAEPGQYWRAYSLGTVTVSADTVNDVHLPFVKLSGITKDASGVAVGNVALDSVLPGNSSWTDSNNVVYSVYIDGESKAVSDAQGNYSIVVHSGGASLTLTPPVASAINPVVLPVNVAANTAQDISLQASNNLSGVIYGAGNVPLPNVTVNLLSATSSSVLATMKTNALVRDGFGVSTVGNYILNLEHYGAAWGGAMIAVSEPSLYWRAFGIGAVAVSGNVANDIHLPFVKLSTRTTDANGVPVTNVSIVNSLNPVTMNSVSVNIDGGSSSVSDAQGNALLVLTQAADQIAVNPPASSGFAVTNVSGMKITADKTLNIVIPYTDTTPPLIVSGPTYRSLTSTAVVVEWQTDEPTHGSVSIGSVTVSVPELSTTHSVQMVGLSPSTPYTAQVSVTDATGNGPALGNASFTTAAIPDIIPPVILQGPTVTARSATGLIVEWVTSEPAQGSLSYGISNALGSSVAETALNVSHRIALTNLASNTEYHVSVSATDAAGNGPTISRTSTGHTLAAADTTLPVIVNGPLVSDISHNAATVTWNTDKSTTGGVSWNDGVAYGVLTDSNLRKNHSAQITGLGAGKTYHLTVSSTDALGNGPTLSKTVNFSTQALANTVPPQLLTQPAAVSITNTTAVVQWTTDEPADSEVSYGSITLSLSNNLAPLTKSHSVTLVGLMASTTYQVQVRSRDSAGNISVLSTAISFATLANPVTQIPVFDLPPEVGYATTNLAVVQWNTSTLTNSQVTFANLSFDEPPKVSDDGALNALHQLSVTGLVPGSTYAVTVSSTDLTGNTVTQSLPNFSTPPAPDSPMITAGPTLQSISPSYAIVTWTTDKLSDSRASYGVTGAGALSQVNGDISYSKQHTVVLTKLKPATAYQVQVGSTDPAGNGSALASAVSFVTTKSSGSSSLTDQSWNLSGNANQAISFAPGTLSLGGTTTASATVSSGLPVSFSSATKSSCTVSANVVTAVAVGTCTIVAEQAGNDSYNRATPVTQNITVSALVPDAPTIGAAVGGNANAIVSFTAPANNGGSDIKGYSVTSIPAGGVDNNATGTTHTITGLTNAVSYTFTVHAINATGNSAESAASNAVTPSASASAFTVSANAGANGNISPSSQSVVLGGITSFTLSPATGYTASVSGCGGSLSGGSYTTGIITANCSVSATFAPSGTALQASLLAGWNLLGNSTDALLNVATVLGNASQVSTVWKWESAKAKWAFYAPLLTSDTLASYAAGKGYDVLTTINAGEGFWVNANVGFTMPLPIGAGISSTAYADRSGQSNSLPQGWSLIATGDSPTARRFVNAIALVQPVSPLVAATSLSTLWAWDSGASNWYFYAPVLDNNGGLADYITSKHYEDFNAKSKTLDPTTGFWVNHP
jgi:Fibronectin type III domain